MKNGVFQRHRGLAEKTQLLVRIYYFVLFGLINAMALPKTLSTGILPNFRWPLGFVNGTDHGLVHMGCAVLALAATLAAGIQPRSQTARAFAFCGLFLLNAVVNSRGATTHLWQFWLWSAFALSLATGHGSERRVLHKLILSWWCAQSIVLIFYGASGIWKLVGAATQILQGTPHLFSRSGISYHIASEILRAGAQPIAAPWVLAHQWIGPFLALGVVAIQLFSWAALVRPNLRHWAGAGFLLFHFGTYLLLGITYPTNVYLVLLLLLTNPFTRSFSSRAWELALRFRRRTFANICVGFLLFYSMLGTTVALSTRTGELFPFFNGHWFVKVPYAMSDYGLWIEEINGVRLENPNYAEHLYDKLSAWPFAIYGAIQGWGEGMGKADEKSLRGRETAIQLIFGDRPYRAELRKRQIDPAEFVFSRKVKQESTVERVERP